MELEMSQGTLIASFDEGDLKGLTVKFYGEWCAGNFFGVYTDSENRKVIAPVERLLTDEEFEHVKSAILAYIEADDEIGKVKFSPDEPNE
ncbi:MAG: hypothetical protein LBH79_01370 [Nitrososphaerota archaeon]|nr:hypothetical protein [Nitrososphaerota archaeon]